MSAIVDAVAIGPEDVFTMSQSPVNNMSFFIATYSRHFPFGRASCPVPVLGTSGWNSSMWVNLGKRGDLVGRFYFVFHIPGIRHKCEKRRKHKPCYRKCDDSSCNACGSGSGSTLSCCSSSSSSSDCCTTSSSSCTSTCSKVRRKARCLPKRWVHYTNAAAHSFIDRVEWIVGGHVIDTHTGEWLEIYDEYTTPAGQTTDEMVGRYHTQYDLWLASRVPQIRYAQMRFSFCEYLSHAIPVTTLYGTAVQARLVTRPLDDCYISSDNRSKPYLMDCDRCLADTDLKVTCWVNTYWVCDTERAEIRNSNHEYLIFQTQIDRHDLCCKSAGSDQPHSLTIRMKHSITELVWTVQSLEHRRNKDWFNYSGKYGLDPLKTFGLRVNGGPRVVEREAKWFRTGEPNQFHTRTPRRHIYNTAFAAFPEQRCMPSGSLCFTLVEVIADLRLQDCLGPAIATFYGTSTNVLRSKNHKLGTAFMLVPIPGVLPLTR